MTLARYDGRVLSRHCHFMVTGAAITHFSFQINKNTVLARAKHRMPAKKVIVVVACIATDKIDRPHRKARVVVSGATAKLCGSIVQ